MDTPTTSHSVAALLTPDQVAARLAISKRTVLRLAAEGKLPFIRLGTRLIRFDPERVESWLKERFRRCGFCLTASTRAR